MLDDAARAAASSTPPIRSRREQREREKFHEMGPYLHDGNHLYFFNKRQIISLPGQEPSYVFVPWVQVCSPGDAKTVPEFPLTPERRDRWCEAVAKWEKDVAAGVQAIEGTLLEDWPAMDLATADRFGTFRVFTVEALADLKDSSMVTMGPGTREWRRRALEYVTRRTAEAPIEALQQKNTELQAQLAEIRASNATQMAALQTTLSGLTDALGRMNGHAKPRRPRAGRRSKAAAPEPAVTATAAE